MRSVPRTLLPALALLFLGLTASAGTALACCAPCEGLCGPDTPPDTVCCSGVPTSCDACGHTACGACRIDTILDLRCAAGCDEGYLACDGSDETDCWGEFGVCMDGCLLEEMICENPPCPGECLDDAFEENDVLRQAFAAPPIQGTEPVRLDGLVAVRGDPDFYHAYADCCDHAGVELRWNPADGDLRAALLDSRGRRMDLSGRGDVNERGRGWIRLAKARYGGHFYVRVDEPGFDDVITCVPYSAIIHATVRVD